MDLEALIDELPYVEHMGIEIEEVGDGHATGRLPLGPELSSRPGATVAHGGVPYALADTLAGAAVISRTRQVSPTVDMRIDYLAPATDDLRGEAEVLRVGDTVATAEVEIRDREGTHVADAVGTFKTSGGDGTSPWETGREVEIQ